MPVLGIAQNTLSILKKYDFKAQKKFGQNFLTDKRILEKIIRTAEITKDDFVIEIGPGIGTLTQYLCENAGYVAAIEIDGRLMPILSETLKKYDNKRLLNGDALKLDIGKIAAEESGEKKIKVVANLPYYITTPIIMKLFEEGPFFESITVMVQKEVAERMRAKPGTKEYGALSLAVQFYSEAILAANVSANCFIPRPGVDSALMHLVRRKVFPVKTADEKFMFKLIRASFNQRRKTLQNGISNEKSLNISKRDAEAAIVEMGLDKNVRGEALSLEQFAELSSILCGFKGDYAIGCEGKN